LNHDKDSFTVLYLRAFHSYVSLRDLTNVESYLGIYEIAFMPATYLNEATTDTTFGTEQNQLTSTVAESDNSAPMNAIFSQRV
jgi:hypothetical protein